MRALVEASLDECGYPSSRHCSRVRDERFREVDRHGLVVYSKAQAEQQCATARRVFARSVGETRRAASVRAARDVAHAWDNLLSETKGLSDLSQVTSSSALSLLRFFPDVPLSQDDLSVLSSLVENDQLSPERKRALVLAQEILRDHEVDACPDTSVGRRKLRSALRAMADSAKDRALQERARTARRMIESESQQAYLEAAADKSGYLLWGRTTPVASSRDLAVGRRTGKEHLVGEYKADLVARLWTGDLMVVEAKHSGSRVNSHKRLVYEAAEKARAWRKLLGSGAAVVVYVSGDISASQVLRLQQEGAAVVFSHETSRFERLLRKDRGKALPT